MHAVIWKFWKKKIINKVIVKNKKNNGIFFKTGFIQFCLRTLLNKLIFFWSLLKRLVLVVNVILIFQLQYRKYLKKCFIRQWGYFIKICNLPAPPLELQYVVIWHYFSTELQENTFHFIHFLIKHEKCLKIGLLPSIRSIYS